MIVEARPTFSHVSQGHLVAPPLSGSLGVDRRTPPVVLVIGKSAERGARLARHMRQAGVYAYVARSLQGCLRMATACPVALILTEIELPDELSKQLRAHPVSAQARIVRVAADGDRLPSAR